MDTTKFYAIVTFGSAAYGNCRGYYRRLDRAVRDARTLGGGSLQTVRVVQCPTAREAREASISDGYPVVAHVR